MTTVSKLIAELQKIQEQHGDLEVYALDDQGGSLLTGGVELQLRQDFSPSDYGPLDDENLYEQDDYFVTLSVCTH